ncbi:MAG: PAS domain-containing protein [Alphaproteobacteria bacterium]|nr:PAS domain-containing protein [Alphaproteobacteria bacterium]
MTGDARLKTADPAAVLPDDLPAHLRQAADLSRLSDPNLADPNLADPNLADSCLPRALAWWQGLREGPSQIPDRIRLDPTQIPDLLPHAILWDVLPPAEATAKAPGRLLYRCRLAGTMLNDFYGREARGQWLHEQFGDESAVMQAEYDAVVRLRRPLCTEHRMSWADKPYYRYRRLMLPFTHRVAAQRSENPVLRADPDRVALLFNVVSFIGA